jgi:uncharacterized membrane protein (UPF0127 family)
MYGVLWVVVLSSLALLGSCSIPRGPSNATGSPLPSAAVVFATDAGTVRTDVLPVANSEAARERGLMGRRTLPPDGGMVFSFPEPTDAGFWMKDTTIPLSVAFWGDDGRVLAMLDMAPCREDPCPIYRPKAAYRTALEMRRGWFDQHGVEIGDHVELTSSS